MKENPVFCVGDMPTQNGTISQIFGGTANRRLSEEECSTHTQTGMILNCLYRKPSGRSRADDLAELKKRLMSK